jgi:hypothetical protein
MAIARITTQAPATAVSRAKGPAAKGFDMAISPPRDGRGIDAGGPPSRQYSASPMTRKRFSSDIATIEARPPPV